MKILQLRFLILSILFIGIAVVAFSDDYYIDDVYYWPSDEPVSSSPTQDASETQTSSAPAKDNVQITFIEDSITQHSDTVVKAVIRR